MNCPSLVKECLDSQYPFAHQRYKLDIELNMIGILFYVCIGITPIIWLVGCPIPLNIGNSFICGHMAAHPPGQRIVLKR
jgi:hypothetical protein